MQCLNIAPCHTACHVNTHKHAQLLPVAMEEAQISPVKDFIITYIMPEKCHEHLFLHLNLIHGPCLKIVLSKFLSVWMLGELIAPGIQIWTVVQSGSVEGLNLVSTVLQLLAVSTHIVACILHKFPVGAYGESMFLLVQFIMLVFLIQYYRGKPIAGCVLLSVYPGVMYLMTSAPKVFVMLIHDWKDLIIISSKAIQATCNMISASTGQLSCTSVVLVFMASLGHTFRTTQESLYFRSELSVVSSCCSLLLLLQIYIYRQSQMNRQKETMKRKKYE